MLDRHRAAALAGLVAPDALRMFGNQDKLATHFYLDRDPATWGHSVETMCRARPDFSHPGRLTASEQAFILGYISHLTVDEAFRETVTARLAGNARWREIVAGLWSLADELPLGCPGLAETLGQIGRKDFPPLVDPEPVHRLLSLAAAALNCRAGWEREQIQQGHSVNRFGMKDSQADWIRRRQMAADFFDDARRQAFIDGALTLGLEEVGRYWDGRYES